MKGSGRAMVALKDAITDGLKHGGLVRLIEWLDDEYYGGAVSEMTDSEQAVVFAFSDLIDAVLWERMKELQLSLYSRRSEGTMNGTEKTQVGSKGL